METRAQLEARLAREFERELFRRLRERAAHESKRAKERRQTESLRRFAGNLRDAYEQTDATAHLTDMEELK